MDSNCVRWTADTERAFLLALRQTGQVVQAAAAIGRAPGVCYDRRDRAPGFKAAWAAVLAEIERERVEVAAAAGAGAGPKPLTRTRADGWTQQRQRAFARALADTGRWGEAAQRVGISMTSVQRLRRRSPAFEEACQRALVEGGPSAAEVARSRALEGWEEPVFHAGKLVGHRRRYSDAALAGLVAEEKAVRAEPRATPEQTNASIMRKLAAMDKAAAKRKRAEQLAWCERMEKAGLAP